jgi:hypothetical protein
MYDSGDPNAVNQFFLDTYAAGVQGPDIWNLEAAQALGGIGNRPG